MNPAVQSVIVGHKRVAYTSTVTSNGTFVVPPDVSSLSLSGHGVAGSNDTTGVVSVLSVSVQYGPGTGAGPSHNDWSNAQGSANSNLSAMNAGGNVTYSQMVYQEFPDGTETISGPPASYSGVVAGSASNVYGSGWQSSGKITSSADCRISYTQFIGGTTGASASGFGQNFPGGAPNSAAPTTSYPNVSVTPGASYSLTVPAGAAITITYYR